MNFETRKLSVPLWLILVISLLAIASILSYWYYNIEDIHVKLLGLVFGIVSGLIVYILTFITLLKPVQDLDRFNKMGIRGLLANRHDQPYYRRLVMNARNEVGVMGASCTRFVNDFLDVESEDKVLVEALTRHQQLKVRLLIPQEKFMVDDVKARIQSMLPRIAALSKQFGGRVELRRFADYPRHSLVVVDDDLIAGPIFDDDKSRYAPAVHVAAWTVFAQKYSRYFDAIWDKSEPSA
jgi:hypothetical protein